MHHVLHFLIHHYSMVIAFGFIFVSVLGVAYELIFDNSPLDHEDEYPPD